VSLALDETAMASRSSSCTVSYESGRMAHRAAGARRRAAHDRSGSPRVRRFAGDRAALAPTTRPHPRRKRASTLARVRFLCTGNSKRSQMAEALCARLSNGAAGAVSAG
jgi:hypothetical protein